MRVTVNRFEETGSMRLQTSGPIGIVTFDRPNRRNALTQSMWHTLEYWCSNLPAKVKLLILRGSGREFTAGSDIKEFARLTPAQANGAFEQMERAIHAVEMLPIPTIAAINGPAYGAGFVLTLACDLRIGSENATFGMPVGKLGITLQPPFIRRMVQHLGPSRAKEMVYTARQYDATTAYRLGLLNDIAPAGQLDEFVFSTARSILQQSKASIHAVKHSVHEVLNNPAPRTGAWVDDKDFVEGVAAFNEKRAAVFR
ncbi:MAG: enoyl-CoA hydratase/isomerase family protein [Alicyclobacillus sp.]|nr:enoyl-CoA hydratase/isomerase family protein [Alicyclobacillus sp.]